MKVPPETFGELLTSACHHQSQAYCDTVGLEGGAL